MGQSSSERAWASRARKSKSLSPEARERLDRYDRSRGRPGRPSSNPFVPPAPAAAAASPSPTQQEPPAPPSPGAGGQGGGPPIDLGAPPANEQAAPDAGGAADDAAAKAAAERAQVAKAVAAYIVAQLRLVEPIIREAKIPLPPLPELVLGVTGKCWEVTLLKWMPAELGDPTEYAELVACGTTGYQLGIAFWARKRLEAGILEVPAVDTTPTPASSSAAAPAPMPMSTPAASSPTANGVSKSKSIFAVAMVEPKAPEAKS